jgi:hypothetical protein
MQCVYINTPKRIRRCSVLKTALTKKVLASFSSHHPSPPKRKMADLEGDDREGASIGEQIRDSVQELARLQKMSIRANPHGASMRQVGEKVYACSLHHTFTDSLNGYQATGGNVADVVDSKCLFPKTVPPEQRPQLFPGNMAQMVSATLTVTNRGPTKMAFTLPNLGVEPIHTAGTSKTFNAIVPPTGDTPVVIPLMQKDTEGAAQLALRYPGYNAQNVMTRGVLRDQHDAKYVMFKADHPALAVIAASYRDDVADAADVVNAAFAARDAPTDEDLHNEHTARAALENFCELLATNEHIKVEADVAQDALTQAKSEFDKYTHLADLTKVGTVIMQRADGDAFNSTNNLRVKTTHNIAALMETNGSTVKQSLTTSAAAAQDPAAALKATADSRRHALLSNIVGEVFDVDVQLDIVYMPSGQLKAKK